MFEAVVVALVYALTGYAALGLVFAVAFVWAGVGRIDSQARGAGVGFRVLILPGVAALWPLFLRRWTQGVTEPAVEINSHRRARVS